MEITLYHGSPVRIKDIGMKSGTYFTDDLEVAKKYGNIVYQFITDENTINIFKKDCFNEHWISGNLIPFLYFDILLF